MTESAGKSPPLPLVGFSFMESYRRIVSALNRAEDLAMLERALGVIAAELARSLDADGGAIRIDSPGGGADIVGEGSGGAGARFCFDRLTPPDDCYCARPAGRFSSTAATAAGCREAGIASLFCLPVGEKPEGLFLAIRRREGGSVAEETIRFVKIALAHVAEGVTRVRAGEAMARRAAELETVNAIGRLITAKLTLSEMAAEIVTSLGQALATDEVNVILYDDERQELTFLARLGEGADEDTARVYPLSDGMNSWIVRNRKPLLITRDSAAECAALGIRHGGRPARSWLGAPMFYQDRVIGVLSVQSYETAGVYDERSIELLDIVAGQCAVAVENARLFEQALMREREKERIYFSLNHDLLALLNPVTGFARLMKSLPPEADRERFTALADSVIASAEKISRFVEDVLIWGKIQSGKLTLNIARVDVIRLAKNGLHAVAPEMMLRKIGATINGVPYRFDEGEGGTSLMADVDAAQMERVLVNVLGNAAKHARSKIEVTVVAADGLVTCRVADDGDGAPSHLVDSLFEEYYQGGKQKKGVGLGLPTVKKIIELHHGALLVESDVGAGFAVEFSWPKTLADRTGRSEG